MHELSEKITLFLRNCGMEPEDIHLVTMKNIFLGQMRIGMYGGDCSIPMYPTHLTPTGSFPNEEAIAVAEVTAQEIRTSLVRFTKDGVNLLPGDSFPTPGTEYPASLEDLLFAIAELLEPLLEQSHRIAFCLPFPMQKTSENDCILLRIPPELNISNWEGVGICTALRQELASRGISDRPIFPVSSIAATLLGGMVTQPKQGRTLSLSWGHGVNSGFSAPKSAILKLKSGETQLMMLDCGSGELTGVPFGSIDLIMDRDSGFPGKDLLNKMTSIQNLGELYRFTMIKAVEANLLTFMCGRNFLSLRKLALSSVTEFISDPTGDNFLADFCRDDEADKTVALTVARAVLSRSARLLCANLAAILQFTGAGKTPDSPALIALSGEAFENPVLNAIFRETVDRLIRGELHLHCKLFYEPTNNLIGSAAAAVFNT